MITRSDKSRSEKWRNWHKWIATQFDHLTRGMTPPIPLKAIFEQCRIKEVIFQPLLVDAGLAVDEDGFVVFVNCPERLKEAYKKAFYDDDQEARYLPGHIRFSLAHELAHILFYDRSKRPYTSRIAARHPQEIESLESACNRGAARLLMPARLLKADSYKKDLLNLDNVIELAEKYGVSLQCLIHRLEDLEQWTPRLGFIALAVQIDGKHFVKAVAKSVSTRELFANIKRDSELEKVFRGITDLQALDKTSGSFDYELTYRGVMEPKIAKCCIEYRRIMSAPKVFLLAVNVERGLEAPKQGTPKNAERQIATLRKVINQKVRTSSEKGKLTAQ